MNNHKVKIALGIALIVFYLTIAALLLFSDLFKINKTMEIILAGLFLAYGIYRGYTIIKV